MNNAVQDNFGLKTMPFSKDIAIKSLFRSENWQNAYDKLQYAVENRLFTVLTSAPGCGKSTMLRALRENLDAKKWEFIYISESNLSPRWLYNLILRHFGAKEYYYRGDCKKAVHEQFAITKNLKNKSIIVCVDESHLLDLDTLQELRFFLNSDIDSTSLVSLILSGQSELRSTLRREICEAIRQRISFPVVIEPLNRDLMARYITAHLRAAGAENADIFSDEAIDMIQTESGGAMRIANQICSLSLMAAASNSLKEVDASIVANVIKTEMI